MDPITSTVRRVKIRMNLGIHALSQWNGNAKHLLRTYLYTVLEQLIAYDFGVYIYE